MKHEPATIGCVSIVGALIMMGAVIGVFYLAFSFSMALGGT